MSKTNTLNQTIIYLALLTKNKIKMIYLYCSSLDTDIVPKSSFFFTKNGFGHFFSFQKQYIKNGEGAYIILKVMAQQAIFNM